MKAMANRKPSYDFYLILATTCVLFAMSVICIYAMFYFKWTQVQEMAPVLKGHYMNQMNMVMAPFVVMLIVLLGICVPKRLLPVRWLNRFAGAMLVVTVAVSLLQDVKTGLLVVLWAALILQCGVLALALAGSERLHFTRTGYWVRLGSSLIHLGIVLFLFDLYFFQYQKMHLLLFWITTFATVVGMVFSFYADTVVRFFQKPQ